MKHLDFSVFLGERGLTFHGVYSLRWSYF